MSYILLNGGNSKLTEATAKTIKSDLLGSFNREVIIVKDFMSVTPKGLKMAEEAIYHKTPPARALALVLTQRKALIEEVLLPAIKSGKSVIYIGGVIDDLRYARGFNFADILKATNSLLGSTNMNQPSGLVYVKEPGQSITRTRDYLSKAEQIRGSVPGLQLQDYSRNQVALREINELFK